jgi:type IV pilus assembly protein PilW
MTPHVFLLRKERGFSLVEIMVGIAIGLLGVLIIMQVSVVFEGQKRTTTTGADAQSNGVSALYAIERDVRRAGYGMSVADVLGCTVRRYHGGAEIANLSLTPAVITAGANGSADTIRLLASSKNSWSLPNRVTVAHPQQGTELFLNTTLGIDAGDLLVAYEAGKPTCTLLQASSVPSGNVKVLHQGLSGFPLNPPDGTSIFPAGGYNVGALVLNMGTLVNHTYSLDGGGNLILSSFSSTANSADTRAIASDIVNIKAQYGFDTRSAAAVLAGLQVDTWSATMINADGAGAIGDAGDVARIGAVRIAVVARSPLMEKKNADGACDITIAEAVGTRAANTPSWVGGVIDVSKNPDGSANANWQCYRYKTFENIIPLRNILWGRT